MTPRQGRAAAARIGYRLDPDNAVRRSRKAYGDRHVSLRPAPDTMTYLTALLPVVDGVAAYAALLRHAATATALGDTRGKGALMVDALVTRLLAPAIREALGEGRSGDADDLNPRHDHTDDLEVEVGATDEIVEPARYLADGLPGVPAGVGIEIQLVMTDRTLFDGDSEPATLTGYGPIPAPLARHLIRSADPHTATWVRRLYTDPETSILTRGEHRRRLFTHTDRQFLIARDQVCRTPWCGAPIRHADHITPHAAGGPTTLTNGAGLCAACNHTEEQPGWTSHTTLDGTILTTTPTGHRYSSTPPLPPRSQPWDSRVA
jgi:hypothetical protein